MAKSELSRADRLTVSYAQTILRWRWIVLALTLVMVVATFMGAQRLIFVNNYRVFFSDENPQLQAFEALQARYTKNDNILFVIAPRDEDVFTPQTLAAVETLTEEAWQVPYSIRVDSLTNYQHTAADGDDLVVADLVQNAGARTPDEIAAARDIALAEPLLRDRLIRETTDVTAVNVTLQLPGKEIAEVPKAAHFARELAAKIEAQYPEVRIYLTGIVMLNNAFPESSQRDSATLIPIMFGIIVLAIALLFRSTAGTLGTVLIIIFSAGSAMGLAGWLNIPLTAPSASAPIIIMTLAIADSVHILVTMLAEMRGGATKRDAIVESLRLNMQPVFLTSLTTVIGFLSMNASDAPPFAHLGNITAMGVVAAYVYSVFFLPVFLDIMPMRVRVRKGAQTTAMDRLAEFVVARRTPLIVVIGLLIIGLAAFIPRIDLNDRFVQYFDPAIEFRADTDFAAEKLSGIYAVEYSLAAKDSGGVADPEYLAVLEAFANWYREQPGVVHVNSLTDIMKRLNKSMHGDDQDWYRLPDDRQLAAQYLLLYEMSLPYGLDLNNQVNVDKSAARLVITTDAISTREVRALTGRADAWLAANAPEHMRSSATGSFVMFAYISKRNIESMLFGTTAALILISLSLILALRSVKFGVISLFPNLVPALMAFGLWGLIVGEANVAISIVTAMSLGIVVDFTIHFLSKYLRARRERDASPSDSVRYAFHTVGTALWVTSVVLIAGFLVLSQSTFMLNAWMGLLTAITIGFALLADFLFLPPVLITMEREQHVPQEKPDSVTAPV